VLRLWSVIAVCHGDMVEELLNFLVGVIGIVTANN
jgi:hypothetical protein